MKTKFLCAVQMVPSCGLPVIFAVLFFFLLKEKKKSQKGEKKKTSKVDV
jgi:preprotein translocase subunit YajC